ncbi:Uncharacterized protein YcnI [Amycolatopsis xylanica]|uniref:Uncharacterized protein YcnI n=2 Tax=Amycolatopsis xylanica TaxID=589385 RepID=A0A1H3B1W9_9PSEU|nr:Uncharacterized protein YcnI [Amycolatopsis xylanica]
MSYKKSLKRAGFLAATVGVLGLMSTGIASAHVTANVYGAQPTKGGYGAIFFRVPNEDPAVGTTKVEIEIKPEYAIGTVRTTKVPGWTAQVTKTKLPAPVKNAAGADVSEVVTKVSWTAEPGNKIAAGTSEFAEFEISIGALPKLDEIEFPATQTYEGNKVVNWNEKAPAGGEEPEHPAPTVKLADKKAEGDHHGGATATDTSEHTEAAAGSDTTARWLAGAGLAVGALGLGVGAGATIRARKAGKGTN